jgi:hypothetical protein
VGRPDVANGLEPTEENGGVCSSDDLGNRRCKHRCAVKTFVAVYEDIVTFFKSAHYEWNSAT